MPINYFYRQYNWILRESQIKLLGLLLSLLVVSCGVTHQIPVSTLEPAKVDLANEIKRIGIINESLISEEAYESGELETYVSITDQQLAIAGTEAAIKGLSDELAKDPRFDTILVLDMASEERISMEAIGEAGQIPWQSMIRLCQQYEVDALFALAHYDTETQISLKKTKVEKKDLIRDKVLIKGHEITLETLIENGWRIYDPFNRIVLDQIVLNDHVVSKAKGEDPFHALQSIEDRRDSFLLKSKKNGIDFGLRLQPQKQIEYREYFAKGTDNMVTANELALSDKWKAASELWEKDMSHPNDKIRSRAYYNMAVANELHGDLESALNWAMQSYDIHSSKMAERYVEVLNHRISNNRLIEEQFLH